LPKKTKWGQGGPKRKKSKGRPRRKNSELGEKIV